MTATNFSCLSFGVKAEISKAVTLRSWWIGLTLVLLLTFYFSFANAQLLSELLAGNQGEFFRDFDGKTMSVKKSIREALLASPYQSAALIVPLLTTFIAGSEYRTNQIITSRLVVPSPMKLLVYKAISSSLLCTAVVFLSFIASAVALWLLIPGEHKHFLFSGMSIDVLLRVLFYALVMNLVAESLTATFRQGIPALFTVLMMLVFALGGVLGYIHPWLNNLLPMIGAKTLLFGYPDSEYSFSSFQGALLLLLWGCVAIALWMFAYRKGRDL